MRASARRVCTGVRWKRRHCTLTLHASMATHPSLPAGARISALDLANLPDADVVALAQAGRETAFRELIRRYERPVFSLIFRMVRDRELAEDLAQDTFIKVLNHIDRYRPEFKLSSWLFKSLNSGQLESLNSGRYRSSSSSRAGCSRSR